VWSLSLSLSLLLLLLLLQSRYLFPESKQRVRRRRRCVCNSLSFLFRRISRDHAPLEKKKKIKQTLFIPLSLTLSVSLVVVCLSPRAREQKECGGIVLKNKNVSLSLRILLFRVSPPTISSKRKKRATHQQKRDTRKRASQLVSGLGSRKASFFFARRHGRCER